MPLEAPNPVESAVPSGQRRLRDARPLPSRPRAMKPAVAIVAGSGRNLLAKRSRLASRAPRTLRRRGARGRVAQPSHAIETAHPPHPRLCGNCSRKNRRIRRLLRPRPRALAHGLGVLRRPRSLALGLRKPYIAVQPSRRPSALAVLRRWETAKSSPCIGLVVSGGHTLLVKIARLAGHYKICTPGAPSTTPPGEGVHKGGKLLKLPYPSRARTSTGSQPAAGATGSIFPAACFTPAIPISASAA